MKKYISPSVKVYVVNTETPLASSPGNINESQGNGVQFTKERNEDFSSDGCEWDTGLW